MNKPHSLSLTRTHSRQTTANERAYGAECIHVLVLLAKTELDSLYEAQSSVHSLQRGAARSPTTLALSMLQALTRPLLAWRNHPLSPNWGKCQRASPDCIGGANCAWALPLVSSEDIAPMMMPVPTSAAPSTSCFIGRSPLGVGVSSGVSRKKPSNYF